MEWTKTQIINLIEGMGSRPMIWNVDNEGYRNSCMKHEALGELALLFGCADTEIQRKWKTLMAQYRRESKMFKDTGVTPKWFGYEPMTQCLTGTKSEYIGYGKQSNSGSTNRSDNRNGYFKYLERSDDHDPLTTIKRDIAEDDTTSTESSDGTELIASKRPKIYTEVYSDSSVLGHQPESRLYRDDIDIYIEGATAKLRKIKDENLRLMVQREIDNLLYDALLGSGNYAANTAP